MSRTARPLYSPHLGQARWGNFFSWQFGHSERPVAVRKSWARRLAVRRVEWRLFGLGMMQFLSYLHPLPARLPPKTPSVWQPSGTGRAPSILGALFLRTQSVREPSQRLPAGVARTLFAGARLSIAVHTAARESPLQSGLHSVLTGRDKSTCSRSTSSSTRPPF
jgi:hypothetical protein